MTKAVALNSKAALSKFGTLSPAHSLESYISFAHSVPMLTLKEEKELGARLKDHNDLEAARRMVMSHLRFVIKVARGFSGYGLPMADLIQEGNIGLMKAVSRFKPEIGVRLVTFAVHWVKAEMHEFIIKNWRIVKVATTKAQRKLFFNLRNSKKRLGWFSQTEINEVAEALNVKPAEVLEMEKRMNAYDASYDAPVDSDSDEKAFHPSMYLESAEENPADSVEHTQTANAQLSNLNNSLAKLDARSQDILKCRWLADKKATLHELAAKYNVSAERIRQLEVNAMQKLKQKMAIAA